MWFIGKLLKYSFLFCILFGLCENAKLPKSNNEKSSSNEISGGVVRMNPPVAKEEVPKEADAEKKTVKKLKNTESIDDMILSKQQVDALYSKDPSQRAGVADVFFRWPKGIVPFEIDASLSKNLIL